MQKRSIKELKVVALIGAPGSGKTRVGRALEEMGFGRFVSGDAFRRVANENTERGTLVNHIVSNRLLVPPEISRSIIEEGIEILLAAGKPVVIDGYRRNEVQLSVIESIYPGICYVQIAVVFEVCRERILNARDRGDRSDDKDKAVFERGFKTFENETLPMMYHLEKTKPAHFLCVDGLKNPEELAKQIAQWVNRGKE
jgi:adenylate kinase family enzyme